MSRISRRSLAGGIAVLPFAAAGFGTVLARQNNDDSTPVASPGASPEASPNASPAAGGATVDVDMLDTFKFEPNEFEIAKGGTIKLHNKGFLEHDFEVEEWEGKEMEQYAKAGETVEVVVPDDAEVGKTYDFICTVAGHKEGGMVGKLTVIEG